MRYPSCRDLRSRGATACALLVPQYHSRILFIVYHLSRYLPIHQQRIYPARNITQFPFLPRLGARRGFTPDLSCFAKRIYIDSGGSSRRESTQLFQTYFVPSCLTGGREEKVGGCSWQDAVRSVVVCFFFPSLVGQLVCFCFLFFSSSVSSSFLQWITCTGSGGQGSPLLALDSWRG